MPCASFFFLSAELDFPSALSAFVRTPAMLEMRVNGHLQKGISEARLRSAPLALIAGTCMREKRDPITLNSYRK